MTAIEIGRHLWGDDAEWNLTFEAHEEGSHLHGRGIPGDDSEEGVLCLFDRKGLPLGYL